MQLEVVVVSPFPFVTAPCGIGKNGGGRGGGRREEKKEDKNKNIYENITVTHLMEEHSQKIAGGKTLKEKLCTKKKTKHTKYL